MAYKWLKCCLCEVCGWEWTTSLATPPARCANPECRSSKWNKSGHTIGEPIGQAGIPPPDEPYHDTVIEEDEYTQVEVKGLNWQERMARTTFLKRRGRVPTCLTELHKFMSDELGVPP